MGLGIIPSGGFFLRDPSMLPKIGFEIPYLAGGNYKHLNIIGTRSGAPVIAFWAIMKLLGIKGFTKIVKKCMNNTNYLAERIEEIEGIKLATKPIMNVVGITTKNGENVCEIEKLLRKKKWMLGKFKDFNLIRVVIMPHVERAHLSRFIEDLEQIAKELKLS